MSELNELKKNSMFIRDCALEEITNMLNRVVYHEEEWSGFVYDACTNLQIECMRQKSLEEEMKKLKG